MEFPNYFTNYADKFFARHLSSLIGLPGLRFLQIGAFTGDASLWMLDWVLTGRGSTLVDVDTWAGSDEPEHEAMAFAEVERVYDERTREHAESGRLIKFKGTSAAFFASRDDLSMPPSIIKVDDRHLSQEQAFVIRERFLASVKNRTPLIVGPGITITVPPPATDYDFVYVDGDHTAVGVLEDFVHAYPLVKVGGLIAFDDYLWQSEKGRLYSPGPAIDAISELYSNRLERLQGPVLTGQSPLQVWFRKTR
jgi:hypothetical protein